MDRQYKKYLVDTVPFWWHTIDFGDGIISPGITEATGLLDTFNNIPSVIGKTVLDIGAWDGYFSFKVEEAGAARVLAIDKPVWQHDFVVSPPAGPFPDTLPGKRGFDVACEIKGSNVDCVVMDVNEVSVDNIGKFDIVLFFGVWYHLTDPYNILEKLFSVTNECLVIETQGIYIEGYEHMALLEFYDKELHSDPSNWFAFNVEAMRRMSKAAGFKKFELKSIYPPKDKPGCRYICIMYK